MGEYPPEPTPPASVTDLSTIFLEDGQLTVDLDSGEKQWVAKVTGTSNQYGFSREWVAYAKPGRDSSIISGTAGVEEGTFIEVGWNSTAKFHPTRDEYESVEENPYRIRRYFQIQNGELVEHSRNTIETQLE